MNFLILKITEPLSSNNFYTSSYNLSSFFFSELIGGPQLKLPFYTITAYSSFSENTL